MPALKRRPELTADEFRDFFRVGWITRRSVFRAREVARMRSCFNALERTAREMPVTGLRGGSYFVLGDRAGKRIIERIVWAGGSQPYLLEIANDARLTVPAAQLLGSLAMDHLLCQAHFKQPRDGVTFRWHQDIEHRDKGNGTWRDVNGHGSYVQSLIVLDPMTPDSGPLKFVVGSASRGRIEIDAAWCARHVDPEDSGVSDAQGVVTIAAEPGDVLFFGPYTVHASFENTSDHARRVLINGYAYPGANRRAYPGDGAGRRLSAPAGTAPSQGYARRRRSGELGSDA